MFYDSYICPSICLSHHWPAAKLYQYNVIITRNPIILQCELETTAPFIIFCNSFIESVCLLIIFGNIFFNEFSITCMCHILYNIENGETA